jgi:hypothetical protein
MASPWTLGSTDGAYALAALQTYMQNNNNEEKFDGGGGLTSDLIPKNNNNTADIAPATQPIKPPSPTSIHLTDKQQQQLEALQNGRSLFQETLFRQSSAAVEAVLAAACEVMGFDIAEMWLRTGPKTHQLTNSHLRPTALEDSVRKDLVDVYYGKSSNARTHRLSPALCKRAKELGDVVWVAADQGGEAAQALKVSISNVRTAVAVPICHEASNTNITIIFFCMRRYVHRVKNMVHAFIHSLNVALLFGSLQELLSGRHPWNSSFTCHYQRG